MWLRKTLQKAHCGNATKVKDNAVEDKSRRRGKERERERERKRAEERERE